MSNKPSDLFDHAKPRPIANTSSPAGRHVPASEYEHGNLSRQPVKSTDHGGDLRQTYNPAGA